MTSIRIPTHSRVADRDGMLGVGVLVAMSDELGRSLTKGEPARFIAAGTGHGVLSLPLSADHDVRRLRLPCHADALSTDNWVDGLTSMHELQ